MSLFREDYQKPHLDWLLLAALTLDLGLWVGLLAWWIWR